MEVREKSSIEDKLSKSGFIPHIWKTMIIPTTTLHSVGGHHLEGSGIPRYPNTWSSTKGSSLRVSEGVKNIKSVVAASINSFNDGILYAASFGHTTTFCPKCTWSTYETLINSNLNKLYLLVLCSPPPNHRKTTAILTPCEGSFTHITKSNAYKQKHNTNYAHMQRLAYKLTRMYYNWSGAI